MSESYINYSLSIAKDGLYCNGAKELDLHEEGLIDKLDSIYDSQIKDYPKYYRMDGMAKLVFILGDLICTRTNICSDIDSSDIAFVMLNATGSFPSDSIHSNLIMEGFDKASPSNFVYTLPNVGMGEVCIKWKITGEGLFLIEDAFSAKRICEIADLFLAQGKCKAIVIGWAEPTENEGNCIFLISNKGTGINLLNTEKNILKICKNE